MTRYYLSADPVKSVTDRALDGRRQVPALAAGAASKGSRSVMVPSGLPRGTYFLLACADQAAGVAEASETNNCRPATTSVIVR